MALNRVNVGYCGNNAGINGASYPADEIACMNNGLLDENSISQARSPYASWDAQDQWLQFDAALTPWGFGLNPESPSFLGGNPSNGFDVGTDPNDWGIQLGAGAWNDIALYYVVIDDITHANDPIPNLLIQRNTQSWTNTKFPNANFPQPAAALGAGVNGDVWASGMGHSISISKYNPTNGTWVYKIGGQPNVKKLAVDAAGGVWLVDGVQGISSPTGRLIHYDVNGQNQIVTGRVVQDVAVGKDGSVWAVDGDGAIFEQSGPTDGSTDVSASVPSRDGKRVAVDNRGWPWVIDNTATSRRLMELDGSR